MSIRNTIAALLLGCMCASQLPEVQAQNGTSQVVRDLETWSSITLNYKMNKKWRFGLNEQLRLKENSSVVDQHFSQLNIRYRFIKPMYFRLGLRYIKENDNVGKIQGYETHFRWHTDLGYRHDIGRFGLNYRVRYQNKTELDVVSTEAIGTARFKVGLNYNIRKWKLDPEVSAELFNKLSTDHNLDRIRFTVGTEYSTKSLGDIGLFYRLERQMNVEYPKTTNIIGLQYSYTIKG